MIVVKIPNIHNEGCTVTRWIVLKTKRNTKRCLSCGVERPLKEDS